VANLGEHELCKSLQNKQLRYIDVTERSVTPCAPVCRVGFAALRLSMVSTSPSMVGFRLLPTQCDWLCSGAK